MITTVKQDLLSKRLARLLNEEGIDNDLNIPDWELAGILAAVVSAIPARPKPPTHQIHGTELKD